MGTEHARRVRAGSIELTVLEEGAGGRPLLVLHGFCGAKENWAEIMGPLSGNGWHVIVPDQRGHGASDHPAGTPSYKFETFVEDAKALTEELGWDRFVLVGHSMGGMTAQLLALDDPSKLDGLILVDTFHSRIEIEADAVAVGRQIVESGGMQALVDSMRGLEDPLVTQAHLRLLAERPGYQELLDSQTLACSPEMWVAMTTEMFGGRDLLDGLRSCAYARGVGRAGQAFSRLVHSHLSRGPRRSARGDTRRGSLAAARGARRLARCGVELSGVARRAFLRRA
jgi:pimeloyl-ACP methyl ester carboxylesterase